MMLTSIQKSTFTGKKFRRHKSFWQTQATLLSTSTTYGGPFEKDSDQSRDKLFKKTIKQEISDILHKRTSGKPNNEAVVMLAAISFVLGKFLGTTCVALKTPLLNTNVEKSSVGQSTNLIFSIGESTEIKDYLMHVNQVLVNTCRFQDFPISLVWPELKQNELTKTGFFLDSIYRSDESLKNCDLVFSYHLSNTRTLQIEYSSKVHRFAFVEAVFNAITQVLTHFEEVGKSLTSKLLMTPEEKHEVVHSFSGSDSVYPDECIASLFVEQVALNPSAIALQDDAQFYSYRELDLLSSKLAYWLNHKHNIRSEDFVGLYVERSVFMVVAILATLKAGAAYVPLDINAAKRRTKQILEQVNPKAILTLSLFIFEFEYFRGSLISLDLQLHILDCLPPRMHYKHSSSSLAYIMFTSGSSGIPKGVMIEQRSVVRLVKDTNYVSLRPGNRVMQLSNYSFDGSVFDIFGALLNGALLCLVKENYLLSGPRFKSFIENQKINITFITTAYFNHLVDNYPSSVALFDKIYFGGEKVSVKHVKEAMRYQKKPRAIVHVYGPTENATFSTYYEARNDTLFKESVPIGKPVNNTRIFILDEDFQPVPVGVPGEICLAGAGLARGYLNDPGLTRDKFLEIHLEDDLLRVYRTGDSGAWTTDGNVEFLGRKDSQIKLRGHRIELGEIESSLLLHPDISKAIAVALMDGGTVTQINAYYESPSSLHDVSLRAFLAERLSEYMIPSLLIYVKTFPLNKNGKIDKTILLDPVLVDRKYHKPNTNLEKELSEIWGTLLKMDQIGILDNFFVCGGDSIKAIRLVNLLNTRLGLQLEVRDIFLYQDIESLVRFIEEEHNTQQRIDQQESASLEIEKIRDRITSDPKNLALLPEAWEDIYPMSHIQTGMIFLSEKSSTRDVYLVQYYGQFVDNSFNWETFRNAVVMLGEKHEILRTSFSLYEFDQPVQIVHKKGAVNFDITFESLTHLKNDHEKELLLKDFMERSRANPFAIQTPGLWRLRLFQLSSVDFGILLEFHHGILDGWSDAAFFAELSMVYFYTKNDKSLKLQPLKASQKDYIISQYRYQITEEVTRYWKNIFEDYERTPLPLSSTKKRIDYDSRSSAFSFGINSELFHHATLASQRLDVSLKTIFLTAFSIFLHKTSSSLDIVFGLVTNDRPDVEDGDKILGCFLNTVPVRIRLSDHGNHDLIHRTNCQLNQLKSYDKTPLAHLAKILDNKDERANPFFDIIFNYVNFYIYKDTHSETLFGKPLVEGYTKTNTLFDFSIVQEENSAYVSINYREGFYSTKELERIRDYYMNILRYLTCRSNKKISELHVLPASERTQLLHRFNSPRSGYISKENLLGLFERKVLQNPQAIAIVDRNIQLTYDQLNRRSNELAHYLQNKYHVKPNDLVPIIADRSAEFIISMLAVTKASAGYLPIDPSFPRKRIQFMVKDSAAQVIIIGREIPLPKTEFGQVQMILWDEYFLWVDVYSNSNLARENHKNNILYVIYTSGSSGLPKAVVIEQKSLENLCQWHIKTFDISDSSRATLFARVGFDASVWEMWPYLLVGSILCIVPQEVRLNMVLLRSFLQKQAISHCFLPTVIFEHFAAVLDSNLNSICFLTGGEKLHFSGQRDFTLYNNYGPTETTVVASACKVTSIYQEVIPIGKPIANTSIYILDAFLKPVPVGVAGEIYIGGVGVARGYLNDPNLTHDRFTFYPDKKGARLYRTGDIAAWSNDGNIVFFGRSDHQVKIRGNRVEVEEIENTMRQLNGIRNVLVIPQTYNSEQDTRLLAYYTSDNALAEAEILLYLQEILPSYMTPSHIKRLESFPVTTSGKIDVKSLPELVPIQAHSIGWIDLPKTEVESALCSIWSEILCLPQVAVCDNFFELGGNSLDITQILLQIFKTWKIKVDIVDFYRAKNIKTLARIIIENGHESERVIQPVAQSEKYELSKGQWQLWLTHKIQNGKNIAYNMVLPFYIDGSLDKQYMIDALKEVWKRHEILRTGFQVIEGKPYQIIQNEKDFQLNIHSHHINTDEDKILEDLLKEELCRNFILENSQPPVYIKWITTSQDHHILVINLHHILADGWSVKVFLQDVAACYQAFANDEAPSLDPLLWQYKDFAAWQNLWIEEQSAEARSYWGQKLRDALPSKYINTDFKPTVNTAFGPCKRLSIHLGKELSSGLRSVASSQSVTVFSVLLSIIKILGFCQLGEGVFNVAVSMLGRDQLDFNNQIGFYSNTTIVSDVINAKDSFYQISKRIHQSLLEASRFQFYPLRNIMEDAGIQGISYTEALPNVEVTMDTDIGMVATHDDGSSLGIRMFNHPILQQGQTKYDLAFSFSNFSDIQVAIEYNSNLFIPETVRLLSERLKQISRLLVDNPQMELEKLDFRLDFEKENSTWIGQKFNLSESF